MSASPAPFLLYGAPLVRTTVAHTDAAVNGLFVFRFAILFSGFVPDDARVKPLFEQPMDLPSFSSWGATDFIRSRSKSLAQLFSHSVGASLKRIGVSSGFLWQTLTGCAPDSRPRTFLYDPPPWQSSSTAAATCPHAKAATMRRSQDWRISFASRRHSTTCVFHFYPPPPLASQPIHRSRGLHGSLFT